MYERWRLEIDLMIVKIYYKMNKFNEFKNKKKWNKLFTILWIILNNEIKEKWI